MLGVERQNDGGATAKELFFFFFIGSNELNFSNILRTCELKLESNLGATVLEIFENFSCRRCQNFGSKWWSKELIRAVRDAPLAFQEHEGGGRKFCQGIFLFCFFSTLYRGVIFLFSSPSRGWFFFRKFQKSIHLGDKGDFFLFAREQFFFSSSWQGWFFFPRNFLAPWNSNGASLSRPTFDIQIKSDPDFEGFLQNCQMNIIG